MTINETILVLSSWVELSILAKATLLLVMGLGLARLAVNARASARHLLLAAMFAALLALPLIAVTAPEMTFEVPVSYSDSSITKPGSVPASGALTPTTGGNFEPIPKEAGGWTAPGWATIVRTGWATGAVLLLVSLAINLWRLRRLRRQGLPALELRDFTQSLAVESGIRRTVEILMHEDIQAPLTYGLRRPVILLPPDARDWSEADLRRVLVHELEHVRRGDWVIQVTVRATCAFYWFHPLIWAAWRRFCLEAERACDDAVIQSAESTEYADQLVLLARRLTKPTAPTIPGMANRSDLSKRVSAILDRRQRRGRAGLPAAASAMLVAGFLVLAIAPIRAVAQSSVTRETDLQSTNLQTRDVKERRSSPLDQALYEAAEEGDISEITRLLNAGADVNSVIDGDGSPLIGAARNGRIEAVRLLLDRGADPNLASDGDGNPLIMAAREGHADVVTLLLDRGARIDEVVPSDENALIQASGNGQLAVVKLLVSRGANVNARVLVDDYPGRKAEWRTPLSMARKGGHGKVEAFLLASGARE